MFARKPTEVMIMRAAEDDLSQISRLHMASFSRGWSVAELRGMFSQSTVNFMVARAVGKPGQPILGFNIFRQTADEAEIISVAVNPAKQGQQIGLALMRDAIRHLMSDRIPVLLLEVDEGNAGAVHLYRKLGFQHVGTRPAYYGATKDDADDSLEGKKAAALVMRLDLV